MSQLHIVPSRPSNLRTLPTAPVWNTRDPRRVVTIPKNELNAQIVVFRAEVSLDKCISLGGWTQDDGTVILHTHNVAVGSLLEHDPWPPTWFWTQIPVTETQH